MYRHPHAPPILPIPLFDNTVQSILYKLSSNDIKGHHSNKFDDSTVDWPALDHPWHIISIGLLRVTEGSSIKLAQK